MTGSCAAASTMSEQRSAKRTKRSSSDTSQDTFKWLDIHVLFVLCDFPKTACYTAEKFERSWGGNIN